MADTSGQAEIRGINVDKLAKGTEKVGIGVLAEATSEAPETEALYIAVQKPMTKKRMQANCQISPLIITQKKHPMAQSQTATSR